ncbi:MAG: PHP domain-containing protein [Deferrisomatales bacterium]|nr:PHP domain-containing protein [Deferrisomatales bacterium]
MLFDLHVHTAHSACSSLAEDDLLRHARRRGLDGVCITDHGTTAVRHQVAEGVQEDGLCVLIGVEHSTPDGDFLVFDPSPNFPPDLPARDLLRGVGEAGGVAVAAHPCRLGRPVGEHLFREGLCRVVESINGRSTREELQKVQRLLDRYPLVTCGGSDAHCAEELGRVVTRFDVPIRSQADLVRALAGGLCRPLRGTPGTGAPVPLAPAA